MTCLDIRWFVADLEGRTDAWVETYEHFQNDRLIGPMTCSNKLVSTDNVNRHDHIRVDRSPGANAKVSAPRKLHLVNLLGLLLCTCLLLAGTIDHVALHDSRSSKHRRLYRSLADTVSPFLLFPFFLESGFGLYA